uniref:Uncharacterized protein n=1 Tax=Anguilla anguilla TaxID=7936 RepID=A0A0E9UAP9_ANGAN
MCFRLARFAREPSGDSRSKTAEENSIGTRLSSSGESPGGLSQHRAFSCNTVRTGSHFLSTKPFPVCMRAPLHLVHKKEKNVEKKWEKLMFNHMDGLGVFYL